MMTILVALALLVSVVSLVDASIPFVNNKNSHHHFFDRERQEQSKDLFFHSKQRRWAFLARPRGGGAASSNNGGDDGADALSATTAATTAETAVDPSPDSTAVTSGEPPVSTNENNSSAIASESSPSMVNISGDSALETNATTSSSSSAVAPPQETTPTRIPTWKQTLPVPLQSKGPKTLQKIKLGGDGIGVEIFLLGTAHVSNDSSADVKLLLEAIKPDCIFVELCEARMTLLEGEEEENENAAAATAPPSTDSHMNNNTNSNTTAATNETTTAIATTDKAKKQDFWDKLENIRQSQGGSRLQALSTLLLTSVQEDYAETLGVELGGEFRAAHWYWKQAQVQQQQQQQQQQRNGNPSMTMPHPSLVLGDRPLSLTLVRAWESLWWWPKAKVLAGLLWSSWHKPKPDEIRAWLESVLAEESDVLTESLQELRQHFPTLYSTIIAERDAWLACKLVQTSRVLMQQQQQQQLQAQRWRSSSGSPATATSVPPKRIVAIVGAGHVPGIVQWLTTGGSSHPSSNSNTTNAAATPYYGSSPEEILLNLTSTRRWRGDAVVQQEMVPLWVHQVTQVQQNEAWSWTDPSTATPP